MADASAPASSANLGPGFDVLALALELRCRVTARPASDWTVIHLGPHRPNGSSDSVLAAAQCAVGSDRPLTLEVDNQIPIGKGLGSSAAAATAGAVAARRAVGDDIDDEEIFQLVSELDAHPDNAAAAVFGGLILCTPDGQVHRLPLHPGLIPLVAVPDATFATPQARAALAADFDRSMVVRSLGRMGALVSGLVTGDERLLAAAAGDELHETPRNSIRPEVGSVLEGARGAGAAHAAWSGSGPAVIALVDPSRAEEVASAMELAMAGGQVLELKVAQTGYQ